MKKTKYKMNFLKTVIVRADFAGKIVQLKDECPSKITNKMQKIAPVASSRQLMESSLTFTSKEGFTPTTTQPLSTIWDFEDRDKAKKFSLNQGFALIEYSKFNSDSEARTDFANFMNAIQANTDSEYTISRLGVRYIDVIEGDKVVPKSQLDWSDYINKKFLGNFTLILKKDKPFVSRVFNTVEYTYPNNTVHLKFGVHNPDHPQPVRKNQFIIDTDIFVNEMIQTQEMESVLESLQDKGLEIFERIITDKLRDIMNAG